MLYPRNPGYRATSFVSFWDDVIRNGLDFALRALREERPEFCIKRSPQLHVQGVFCGEEKDPGVKMESARRDILKSIVWSYGDAPYLFGYAAVGYEFRLYAITRVDAIELGVYDIYTYVFGRAFSVAAGNSERRAIIAGPCEFVPRQRTS
ncbi:Crinkler (CRN) [Phytophthora megakarya]|uniref:Crinkler (CRN) n=1 Tax=Phytophthora megakarya TaxID=4795 RepID=A0A225VLG5_9STRA|nr:Crinkler (CRN) [Phytophthora megakarya]